MNTPLDDHKTKTIADTEVKAGHVAAKIFKDNETAVKESSNASIDAFQELSRAYQELASKNSAKLTKSIQELSAVKSPTEFVQLQQKLVKEAFDSAVADCSHMGNLTMTIFNSAFEPMKTQFESAQKTVKHARLV